MLLKFKADFDIPVELEKQARELLDRAEDLMGKSLLTQLDKDPVELTGEESFLELHWCHHGEEVNRPCEPIKRIDLAGKTILPEEIKRGIKRIEV